MIKLKDLIQETVDVLALIQFYKRATDAEQVELERLINTGKQDQAKELIRHVTMDGKMIAFPQRMPDRSWRASRKGAS